MDSIDAVMLVYEHKANGRNMVPNGSGFMTEEELVMAMSLYPEVRLVKKKIPLNAMTIEILKIDLLYEEEKKDYKQDPNECPWMVFFHRDSGLDKHGFEELTILVPEVVAKGGKEPSKK